VDIQPIAVQIAKLRFFISLIIDQKADETKSNFGIRSLPNLETKFVAANTLIGFGKKNNLFRTPEIEGKENEIKEINHNYFTANRRKKTKLQQQSKILREELAILLESTGFPKSEAEKIAKLDLFDQNKSENWFDPEWMFGLTKGFDIVIGNPPYVFARNSNSKGMTDMNKAYFYKNYMLSEYQINLYPLFIEAGTRLLNNRGLLCYITPNNWLTLNTNKKLRYFVLEKSNITILNFYKRVFESADVDSAIVLFQNTQNAENTKLKLAEWENEYILIGEIDKDTILSQKDYIINIETIKGKETFDLLSKIENISVLLSEIATVKVGLKAYQTGKGKPSQTEEIKKNRAFHSQTSGEGCIKYLDGCNVCRYYLGWSGEFLKYGKHLAEPRTNFDLFSTPRILVRQIPSPLPYCINACYTDEILLNDLNSMNIIYMKVNPKYLLGILNSRLISYWFALKFGKLQRGIFPQFKINELAQFPIPNVSLSQQQPIITLVEQILQLKKQNADTSALETEIDKLVYELYGLTDEEITIVDGN
jgi:hypothetical protein